ncbi:MAG: hypothetical protein M3Z54_10385 [Gemmatimonadota bacterium]|nr:hypothetical protein [Gemmatimonadota bacterium]
MPKAETGAQAPAEKTGRHDTVRPPASLPDGTPFERMAELARRLFGVPKAEAIAPKKRPKRKR